MKKAVDRNAALVLPSGATEQHGPHLPLGTDVILPVELLKRIARSIDVIIAPPLSYGYKSRPMSGGGQRFVGTTSLRGQTMIQLTRDVVGEFLRHGFRRVVIVNWHLESASFVYEGADLAARDAGLFERVLCDEVDRAHAEVYVIDESWPLFNSADLEFLFPEGLPGWDAEHAGVVETSLMMALRPDLVRWDEMVDDAASEKPRYDIVPPPKRILTHTGVLSRSTPSSQEKGEFLVERMVDFLVDVFTSEFPDLVRKVEE